MGAILRSISARRSAARLARMVATSDRMANARRSALSIPPPHSLSLA
jgi:hypothetical protein